MRAIIVDDSRAMRSIIGQILRGIGYEIAEAGNGREALQRLDDGTVPDVALVDWNMPEMNGLDLVRAIRGDRRFDSLRIIMVTTESEAERMASALEHGADEYVMKPFTRDVIVQKLEQLHLATA